MAKDILRPELACVHMCASAHMYVCTCVQDIGGHVTVLPSSVSCLGFYNITFYYFPLSSAYSFLMFLY